MLGRKGTELGFHDTCEKKLDYTMLSKDEGYKDSVHQPLVATPTSEARTFTFVRGSRIFLLSWWSKDMFYQLTGCMNLF